MSELNMTRVSREIENAKADVVFVHGIGGSSEGAWTSNISAGKGVNEREIISFFPSVLASDFPDCNVWCLNYPSDFFDWSISGEFAEFPRNCINIMNYILGYDIGSRPVLFVCHSLGGILVKEILRMSAMNKTQRIKRLFENTRAVSFIASPHSGSMWADILSAINSVLPFWRSKDELTKITYDNSYLEQLGDWYRNSANEKSIETQAFYETKKTKGIIIVSHISANPNVGGCLPIGINRNHIDICKPTKKSDLLYISLNALIRGTLLNGPYVSGIETAQNSIPPQTIIIGVIRKNDKVLMVRRRNPIDKLTWQFVAGRLKVKQETEEECIIREVKEETCIDVSVIRKLDDVIDSVVPYQRIYYALEYLDGEICNGDVDENSDVKWVPISKIQQFVTTPINGKVFDYLAGH